MTARDSRRQSYLVITKEWSAFERQRGSGAEHAEGFHLVTIISQTLPHYLNTTGRRGVPSRIDLHDYSNQTVEDTSGRVVSATLGIDYIGDDARVSVTAHPVNPEVDLTLDISISDGYLRVALSEAESQGSSRTWRHSSPPWSRCVAI